MKLFKQERLGILEGLLFAVGDEGVSLEQLEYVIDVNEVEVKSLILDLKARYKQEMCIRDRYYSFSLC